MPECNVDDILCQMTALNHLRGLKSVLGDEKYQEEFPELQGLDDKIAGRETKLRATLRECSQSAEPEAVTVKPAGVIEEEKE